MTDKQIIIDGCDVSGCEWIREVGLDSEYICTCNSPNKTSGYCKYNPNCHYKQLKRKEQECEKKSWEIGNLGYKIKNQRKEINIRLEQLDQLKAKLELFKKSNITTIDQLKAELEQEKALKETYLACYKAKHEDIEGELFKLKQTLTEIKEIAEEARTKVFVDMDEFWKQILQKISEVEDDIE